MIIDESLSLSQQAKGRKKLLFFSFLNGISLTFITGNVLSLYLLKVGCSTPVVAVIASFAYLGTLFAFTGKSFIARLGAAATLRLAWIFCGLAAIALALIPFFTSWIDSKPILIILITSITFLFFIFKSIGTASTQPLMGEFTDKDNQGDFSSKYFLYYSIATVLAIGSILCLMFGNKTLLIFQLVIFLGGLLELACSSIFIGMRESEVPRKSAQSIKTKKLLSAIWNQKELRTFLYCRSFTRAAMILIIPISILALKKLYGVSDQIAMIFAFVQLAGGIMITYLNGIISEETGPKPLIAIYVMLLFIISLLWIFAPLTFHWGFCFIVFFVGGICLCGLDSCLNHYYLSLIPRKDSVGISLWYTVIGGAVAGIAGLFLGGGLIKLLLTFAGHSQAFRYYYTIMFLLMIPVLYIVLRLKTISDWRLRDVLKLSIAPREMHTIYAMHHIQKYSTFKGELANVHKLEQTGSDLSQDKLIYYLKSPRYIVRIHALRALHGIHLKKETIKAVFEELKYGEYTTAYCAAALLSEGRIKRAIPHLQKYLSSKNHHLVAVSMLGLVRLEAKEHYPQIIKIFKAAREPKILILGAIALGEMNNIETMRILLKKLTDIVNYFQKIIVEIKKKGKSDYHDYGSNLFVKIDSILNEIICSIAQTAGVGDQFYKFLRIYETSHQKGILSLIEMLKVTCPAATNHNLCNPQQVLHDYTKGKIKKSLVFKFLRNSTKDSKDNPTVAILSDFLEKASCKTINNKLIYCIFLILFCENK